MIFVRGYPVLSREDVMRFSNREAAGHMLAEALRRFGNEDVVVFALPRGGVVVGAIVAKELDKPFGVVQVRKIGHPSYPEHAIGAVAEYGDPIYNEREAAALDDDWLREVEVEARNLMAWRRNVYFSDSYISPEVKGKILIVVDDGIATGLSMRAAVQSVRNKNPAKLIIAAPIASRRAIAVLESMVDEMVVLDDSLQGTVSAHYLTFPQIDDDEVREVLGRSERYGIRQAVALHS